MRKALSAALCCLMLSGAAARAQLISINGDGNSKILLAYGDWSSSRYGGPGSWNSTRYGGTNSWNSTRYGGDNSWNSTRYGGDNSWNAKRYGGSYGEQSSQPSGGYWSQQSAQDSTRSHMMQLALLRRGYEESKMPHTLSPEEASHMSSSDLAAYQLGNQVRDTFFKVLEGEGRSMVQCATGVPSANVPSAEVQQQAMPPRFSLLNGRFPSLPPGEGAPNSR